MITEIDIDRQECIYCHKKIDPMVEHNRYEIRIRCPNCSMTLEVIKRRNHEH